MKVADQHREHLEKIREAWAQDRLVLFIGGGASIPHGIPDWSDLILELLFEMRPDDFQSTWPHYRFALGRWFVDTFSFAPTVLARLLSDEKSFLEEVRRALYRNFSASPQGHSALNDIADLVARSSYEGGRHIRSILTFNFDDLLEEALSEREVEFDSLYAGRRATDRLPIIHLHGFLPRKGPLSEEIVLSEDEFHRLSFSTVEWVNSELAHYLHNYTGLFIGLSMNDPNLRRLLDATCVRDEPPRHYLLRRCHDVKDRQRAAQDIQRRADEAARHLDLDRVEDLETIASTLDNIVDRVHDYEERLFGDLGLHTIWLDRYADIAEFLKAIR